MKTYRRRRTPLVLQIGQACLAWLLLGIAAAIVSASSPRRESSALDPQGEPTAEAIERAVVEAETQANILKGRTAG